MLSFAIFIQLIAAAVATEIPYSDGIHEYCQLETFSARCHHGDVIVMTTARFGRMRLGRCIDASSRSTALEKALQSDSNLLGCYADVLDYADRMCTGKTACDIAVPNHELLRTRPCFTQLTMYFEAAYQCVSVVKEDRSCVVRVSDGLRKHIRSGSENSDSGRQPVRCGSRSHPWLLEAQTGQQINISLLDFSGHGHQSQPDIRGLVSNDCSPSHVQYGYIVDKSNKKNVSICSAAAQQRHEHLYQSVASTVEIVLTSHITPVFLLSFQAVGCSNLVPPSDAWLRRTDNEATIGCYTTRQRWNLRCHGNQWKGTVGVCVNWESQTAKVAAIQEHHTSNEKSAFFQVVAIVTIATVGLAICLVIIFIGIGCARRYQHRASSVDVVNQQLIEDVGHGQGEGRKSLKLLKPRPNEFDDRVTAAVHRPIGLADGEKTFRNTISQHH